MELSSIEAELEALARQYQAKSPEPAFSFMPRGDRSDRGLRIDDLDSAPKGRASSPFRSEEKQGSRAVAGAMKALQDKIKRLESANESLRLEITARDERLAKDRELWQQQSHRDSEDAQAKEALVLSRIRELEEELRKQRLKDVSIEEYVKSLTRQLQTLQEEMDEERASAEQREAALQDRIETAAKQVEQKNKEAHLLDLNLQNAEKERSRLQSENTDLALELDKVSTELEYLKESGESSASSFLTKMHEKEQQSARKVEECLERARDLELRNQHLTELLQAKEKQLEFMKVEIENLKRANASAESARMASLLESERARKVAYDMSLTNERLTQSMRETEVPQKQPRKAKVRTTSATRSRSKSPRLPTRLPPSVSIESPSSDSDFSSQIAKLEREIASHNADYRAILDQADSLELTQMRASLTAIAEEMEAKSKELSALKRKQQSHIRSQVREMM